MIAQKAKAAALKAAAEVDFAQKAERRGVTRAAIELAVRLLATNQEQHRTQDRFRIVKLPPAYKPPQREVPLSLPLEPWKRPKERDTFEYCKKVAAFHQAQDLAYQGSRQQMEASRPGELPIPHNRNGPFAAAGGNTVREAAMKRFESLQRCFELLEAANTEAPRPLIHRILRHINHGLSTEPADKPPRLSEADLKLLSEIGDRSWDDDAREYNYVAMFRGDYGEQQRFQDFVAAVKEDEIWEQIPLWQPVVPPFDTTSADLATLCSQERHDSRPSLESMPFKTLVQLVRDGRLRKYGLLENVHMWTDAEALRYIQLMAEYYHLQ